MEYPQYKNHYLLKNSKYSFLRKTSCVKCEDIRNVDKVRLSDHLGNIDTYDLDVSSGCTTSYPTPLKRGSIIYNFFINSPLSDTLSSKYHKVNYSLINQCHMLHLKLYIQLLCSNQIL